MSKGTTRSRPASVTFCSYPKLLFCWPLIVLGPLLYFVMGADPSATKGEIIGWLYLPVMALVLLTISVDLERNHSVFWLIVFAMVTFLLLWLGASQDVPVFSHIYDFLDGLDVHYDRGFGLGISIFLLPPYLVMFLWARVQNRWRITHNEFEHFSWGRAEDSLARGAKRVRSTYPDLLEFILGFGAGTLIVYSATGQRELRRIHHVPMLPILRKRIDRILESTSVTVDEMADEEAETERDEDSVADEPGEGEVGNEKL